jgi:hypothetical protein
MRLSDSKFKGVFVLLLIENMPKTAGRQKKPSYQRVLSVSRLTDQLCL